MADEVDPQQLAEQLLAQAKAQGVDLVGPNGQLNQLAEGCASPISATTTSTPLCACTRECGRSPC
jgi:hypothetical protein